MRYFIENKTSFQMVESDSYFEAYRHNLSALQKLTDENLPFKDYIVFGNKDVLPPKYLLENAEEPKEPNEEEGDRGKVAHEESLSTVKETENAKDDDELSEGELDPATVYFDLKIICDPKYSEDCDQNMSSVPVLELDQWPNKEVLGLDESQYRACQLALTKRFALIQGPPGTGKTYVGLKIAHALLDNRDLWSGENRSPILMVSYTNHALDQFLMGLNNKQGIVRVGSRSRVEELYNYNLKMLRKRKHHDEDVDLLYLREKDGIRRKIMEIESKYLPKEAASLLAQSNKAVISLKGLQKFIEFEHFKALKPFEQCSYVQMDEELLRWLDIEIRPAKNRARKEEDKQFLKEIQRMSSFRESIDEDIEVIDTEKGKFFPACYIDDAVEPNKLRDSLENSYIMAERREIAIDDIWQLRLDERWRLYRLWRDRLQDDCQKRIIDSQDTGYETELKKLQESNEDVDFKIFRNSRVIGMTTSCAAKYHSLLQRVKPKVVIVEEAAEVLEAHILTSLPLDCEHVILIGDHQQLRPSCTVYELAKKYNLNISMFERLVKLQMPCVRLSEQHRMRPEIASLMKHIYEDLQDHPSVKEYDNMRGVEHNVFFIDHRHHEDSSEDSFSHLNEHEAQFLVRLCRYFVQQGYEPSQITILTPYLGQMFMIRDHMTEGDDDLRKQTRLTTIDNYQGEENDIILLSLVRSNDTGHVGFILLKEPKDFLEKVPYGGCDVPCMCRLRCGHSCKLSCHPFDKEHEEFKCLEQCARTIRGCENGHLCEKECSEPCDFDCNYPVDKILRCGHTKKNARCSVNIQRLECDVRCEKKLKCGHQCQAKCGKSCTKACQELEKRNDWPCGHEVTIACSATPFDCPGPCGNPICDHICSGSCGECLQGRVHRRCMKTCGRVLVCGHECRDKCTITCPPCTNKCETKCKHSECRRKCGEPCVSCTDQCEWKCEHFQCSKKCGEICDRPRCDEPCRKLLQCKHRCRGLCNEPCICVECEKKEIQILFGTEDFDDETVRFIQLRGCEHIFEVRALDHWMDMGNDDQTEQNSIQPKVCPGCKTPIQTMMRYNNVIKKQLKDIERVKGKLFKPLSEERRYKVRKKLTQYLRDASSNSISSSAGRKRRHDEVLLKRIDQARNLFEITNIGNQVELLTRCHTLIKKATETKAKIADEKSAEMKDVDLGISVLKFLEEKRIVGSVEREITDIELELKRQKVVIEICSLLSKTESLDISLSSEHKTLLDNIRNSLSKASSNEKPELDSYLKEVEEIRSTYPIAPPTREEKDQIIKVMGLSKGHWYKCRQGHVYAIGECGGAMETGTCPECHDVIGGASHRLAEGNKVATEMDGARHSAWSEQANMGNYDLQE
ncbi:NFX1-type zinc finger-containing protein 1-like [Actinia tenebrosa]|uniref:NFX1-type zinc finger-containing protein 1-like n=1 Tax=Actinia tenebrosa TaxID=6105 RepID=A0A6P8H0M3_ACTTE|nr:NFX1-type zinc finger-containing protein 1-like [Actinia tenebrosa]